MRSQSLIALIIIFACASLSGFGARSQEQKKKSASQSEEQGNVIADGNTVLVNVPVVASDRNDVYVPDLKKEEFKIYEDGVEQSIEFFAAVSEPFQVVLLIDTSASTEEKLGQIQSAAVAFVRQLQPADRVKIISFDDAVREHGDFTNDRAALERAIKGTEAGEGTKLYDAMKLALNNLARLKGRKAVVIFTDGVDWRSDRTTSDDNLKAIEESGVIVYPIRYDTRAETEALVREQQNRYGSAVDVGLVLGGPPIGTTPPTVPGEGPSPIPQRRKGSKDDPYRLPGPDPSVILNDPRIDPRNRYPRDPRDTGRYPDGRYPRGGRYPGEGLPEPLPPAERGAGRPVEDRFPEKAPPARRDSVSVMLDNLYLIGDRYLEDLARFSGGKLHRADTLRDLPKAFALIAAELRQQYSLGYYPTNSNRDGKYRKIEVKVSRKDVVIRARPGYRPPRG